MRKLPLLATAAWLAASASAIAESRAVLIGIGEYPFLPPDRQLGAPKADVEAMLDLMLALEPFRDGWHVSNVGNVTADEIAAQITRAAEASEPGDDVLIYFSGHGSRVQDLNGDEADGYDEVLVASDFGAPEDHDPDRILPGYITDDVMAELLAKFEGRDVTVILDACHSATGTRAGTNAEDHIARGVFYETARSGSNEPVLRNREKGFAEGGVPTLKVWAAAGSEQFAWEGGGRGVFTDLFIRGLAGREADSNGNGIITNAELLDFTREGSATWCEGSQKCREIGKGFTPSFEGPVEAVALRYTPDVEDALTGLFDAPMPVKTPILNVRPSLLPAVAAEPDSGEPQLVEPEAPLTLEDLLGQGNDAGLTLAISNGPDLTIGQAVHFEITTERDGTLVLFDVNPRGELLQLSPSVISRDNVERVAAGETILVPEGLSANGHPIMIEVTEPTGVGQLAALLIEDETIDVETLLGTHLTGDPIPDARAMLADLAARLRETMAEDGTNRAAAWSAVYQTYTIQP